MSANYREREHNGHQGSWEMELRTGRYRGRKDRHMRRRRRMLASAGMLTAMAGWFLLAGLWGQEKPGDAGTFVSQAAEELNENGKSTVEKVQQDSGIVSSQEDSTQTMNPQQEPEEVPAQPDEQEPIFVKAGEGYFNDALFIGDSRTQGLELYGGIDEATYYTSQGLMVNSALVKTVANVDGQQMSIPDALDVKQFGKVYIMLGINELGWKSQDRFIEYYGQLIDTVREKQPDAVIYVQSLPPVTKEKSQSSDIFNNERVALYNECIKKALEGRDAVWLDVGAALQGEDGCMPEGSTFDGIHLNQQYCKKWAEFLRENTLAQ